MMGDEAKAKTKTTKPTQPGQAGAYGGRATAAAASPTAADDAAVPPLRAINDIATGEGNGGDDDNG